MVNCGPQSDIMMSGSPYLLNTSLMYSSAVSIAVIISLQGDRITPFESPWLTTTKIESNPLLSGKSMMKSIVIC